MLVYQGVHTRNWRWFVLVNPHLPQQMMVRMMRFQVWVIQESKVASTLQPNSMSQKDGSSSQRMFTITSPPCWHFTRMLWFGRKKDGMTPGDLSSGGVIQHMIYVQMIFQRWAISANKNVDIHPRYPRTMGWRSPRYESGMHLWPRLGWWRSTWSMSPQTVDIRGDSWNRCASSCFSTGHLRWPFLGLFFAASRSIKYNFQEILWDMYII